MTDKDTVCGMDGEATASGRTTLGDTNTWSMYGGNVLWLPVFALTGFGILFVYSASSVYADANFGSEFYFVKRQMLFLIPALFAALCGALIPLDFYLKHIKKLFCCALVLTFMTHLPFFSRKVGGA